MLEFIQYIRDYTKGAAEAGVLRMATIGELREMHRERSEARAIPHEMQSLSLGGSSNSSVDSCDSFGSGNGSAERK